MSTRDTSFPKVERVEVHAAQPEPADLRRITKLTGDRSTAIEPVTWLYKLYVPNLPPPQGAVLELFVGDEPIHRYSDFPGGIYFTVNDPELARRLGGAPIRFRHEGETEVHDTGARVPAEPHEVAAETARAGRVLADLPRQADLLRH